MSHYGYLPHEYTYALFLADYYDLYPWDSLITNMVLERYPRDEDDDASASALDEDDDSVSDEVLAVSAPILETSASHDCIFFGSFDSPIVPVSTPSIEPKFDGFSVKIGEISCVFVDSCKNIVNFDDSVFVASEENGYVKVLEPELKIRNSVYGFSKASEHFITHATPVRLRSAVYGVAAVRPFASWLFVGKQPEHLVSSDNYQLPFFKLHDESIVDFDPGGKTHSSSLFSVCIFLRNNHLWWMPWDRGRTTVHVSGTHSSYKTNTISVQITFASAYQESRSVMFLIQFLHSFFFSDSIEIEQELEAQKLFFSCIHVSVAELHYRIVLPKVCFGNAILVQLCFQIQLRSCKFGKKMTMNSCLDRRICTISFQNRVCWNRTPEARFAQVVFGSDFR